MVTLVDSVNLRLKQSHSFTMDQKREGAETSEAISPLHGKPKSEAILEKSRAERDMES